MISPSRFIPITEKSGLIGELAERILKESCTSCVDWQARFPGVGVAFNLSAVQFTDARLPKTVAQILQDTGLPPQLLELEITENVLLKHSEQVHQTLLALRQLGCTLAIDDFGTGYSSLAFLKRFAVNVLKIDKSFVDVLGAILWTVLIAHSSPPCWRWHVR
jgi:EAL domain-containing protein (putative c-di-GMP-specific phosphodiesterase class I)